MSDIEQEVKDNYTALKAERGLSWEQIAQQVGRSDANTAAWLRSQAEPERVRNRTRRNSEDA